MTTSHKTFLRLTASMLLCLMAITALGQVPERPNPPRLVNDFAGILGNCEWLEDSLEKIAMETSNQICVVTMNDFGDYDRAKMAYTIGDKWGVGKSDKDNGVVILIKPKTENGKGEAFIAPGSGLEGAITDAASRRIVDNVMIPYFKNNDYLGGVWAGVQTVRELAIGEYNEEDYVSDETTPADQLVMIIIFIIIAYIIYLNMTRNGGGGGRNNSDTGTWGGPIIVIGGGSSWDSGGSSWGGGSSGGGWGGFGGGSFGGGGGGGSW